MKNYQIKNVDYLGVVACALIVLAAIIFPFANPCTAEDGIACTWKAEQHGNGAGSSFTDYYGLTIYHPRAAAPGVGVAEQGLGGHLTHRQEPILLPGKYITHSYGGPMAE